MNHYTDNYSNIAIQQGWQCPLCGRVYSPTTMMCLYCGNTKEYTTISYKTDYVHNEEKQRRGQFVKNNNYVKETYCKDCDRSIYGKYHDCDINIENNGAYVMSDSKCYCKITNGHRAEKYPWEEASQ